ncbi:hypothetical protein CCACVL1_09687 [Corchorus capsularis]|uniref:Uncharacterized protein n=1 Tax=Corchorus capsularis TaxID=210143 RepID=A0A1R3IUV3_COCAP|nr:hypothetical protein CCACVL1_09687 [Corchorus capsularis]
MKKPWRPSSRPCCIYRAHVLRDVDRAAFTPEFVSIGPLYHFDKNLKGMEETKVKYLEQFLQHAAMTEKLHEQHEQLNTLKKKLKFLGWKDVADQIETAVPNDEFSCLGKFLGILTSLENDIRSSYAENLNHITSKEFLRIVLVDAAFIIELFLRGHFDSDGDPLLSRDYLPICIRMDLWLLENQLPFFVLQQLYDSAFGSFPDIYPPFLELTCNFFELYNAQEKPITREVNHFTDLLRAFFLPSSIDGEGNVSQMKPSCNNGKLEQKEESDHSKDEDEDEDEDDDDDDDEEKLLCYHLPSATRLHAAGVKFVASESKCLLDIKFSKGRLEVPTLQLFDETVHCFRNLIALEQYHYEDKPYISHYLTFMDYLVDTGRDVDLLVENKIIKHWLGSNGEVARIFNSLCINITKGYINRRFFYLIEELNKYHDRPWNSWKATLYSQYFSTPWRSASTSAAIILLVLTLAQTIMAAIAM